MLRYGAGIQRAQDWIAFFAIPHATLSGMFRKALQTRESKSPPYDLRALCGESLNLTNANISTTLDTSPCADLEISRDGDRIARSKKELSQDVRKCQVKRDPPRLNLSHCSTCTKFFKSSLALRLAFRPE